MDLLLSTKFSKIHKQKVFNIISQIPSDLMDTFPKMKQEKSLITQFNYSQILPALLSSISLVSIGVPSMETSGLNLSSSTDCFKSGDMGSMTL